MGLSINIGGGFLGTLTIVFVILKALGYLTWSWWLVFLPVLIPLGIVIFIIAIILIILIIYGICKGIQYLILQ